jgi:predicted dehydrogenase
MTATDTCKVAIVGGGGMAREHARAFAALPEARLVGICNRTHSKAEEIARSFAVPVVCDNPQELYAKTGADLVVMAVAEHVAKPISFACFEYPWTILLEKPPGQDLAEAREILQSAGRRRVYVAMNRRAYSSTRTAKADLDQIDAPRFIHVQDQQDMEYPGYSHLPRSVVENLMYSNSIHLIDYFCVFGRGRVSRVRPAEPWSRSVPQVIVATIDFDSGDKGLYQCIWRGPGPWSVSINTPMKRWELRPLEKAAFQRAGERSLVPVETESQDREFKPGLVRQAQMAVAAAMGKPTELATLSDAITTMELIQAIYGL